MWNIKNRLKTVLAKKRRIVITFVEMGDGQIASYAKVHTDSPVGSPARAIDRLKAAMSAGVAKKVTEAGYKKDNPQRRMYMRLLKLGEVMP
jgi:hypothetical protein